MIHVHYNYGSLCIFVDHNDAKLKAAILWILAVEFRNAGYMEKPRCRVDNAGRTMASRVSIGCPVASMWYKEVGGSLSIHTNP